MLKLGQYGRIDSGAIQTYKLSLGIQFLLLFLLLVDNEQKTALVRGPNGGSSYYSENELSRCAEIFFQYVRYLSILKSFAVN